MKKRILSSVLALVIALSALSCLSGISVSAATTNQQHIVDRANYMFNSMWTCKKTVTGWRGTFYAGNKYHIPYGQPVYSGTYVGFGISVSDFLAATSNPNNIFYTGRSHCGGTRSTYYANDCSAFVSYCWGTSRKTTYSIPGVSTYKGMATAGNAQGLQLGDCLNSNSVGHVVLVTGLKYSNGAVSQIEITEQTPPQLKRSYYTPAQLGSKYGGQYGIYRYSGSVPSAPGGYTSGPVEEPFSLDASKAANVGDDFYARITNTNSGKEITAQSGDDGGNVAIEDMRNLADQQFWHFQRQSDNSYKITNVKFNKPLDVYGGGSGDGSNVGIYTSNDGPAQRWYIFNKDGKYVFRPKCSDKVVMDVAGMGTAHGTNVITWTYNGCGAQTYSLTKFDYPKYQLFRATVFNAKYYADKYSDLKNLFGYDEEQLYTHFIYHGIDEGRQASPIFNIKDYISKNAGIDSNYFKALIHFHNYGVYETRYTAECENLGDNFYAKITNVNSKKNLSYNSSASVIQVSDSSSASQLWLFNRQGDGSYKISNKQTGQCLDVYDNKRGMGADIITWASTNGDNQRWFLFKSPAGGYILRSKLSPACVADVENGSADDNANIRNWSFNSSAAQAFNINKVDLNDASFKLAIKDVKITNISGRGYTVTASITSGAGVQKVEYKTWSDKDGQDDVKTATGTFSGDTYTYQVSCKDHNFEYGKYNTTIIAVDGNNKKANYTITANVPKGVSLDTTPVNLGDDFFAKITNVNANLNLTLDGADRSVITYTNSASEAQLWRFIRQSDGSYVIKNKKTGKAIDVDNGRAENGTDVLTWDYHGNTNQKWNVYAVDGGYVLRPLCSAKQVLDVNASSKEPLANVQLWSYNAGGAQLFTINKVSDSQLGASIADLGNEFYAKITNTNANRTLGIDGANVVTSNNANIWKFTRFSDGSYKIINYKTNKALDADNGNIVSQNNTNVGTWDYHGNTNQKWFILEVSGGYIIKPVCSSKFVLDVAWGSKDAGANLILWESTNAANQKFTINKIVDPQIGGNPVNLGEDFTARIANVNANLNLTLDGNDSSVITYTASDSAAQQWRFVRQSNGSYKIINKKTNKCLDVSNGVAESKDGSDVGVWEDNGGTNQRWNIFLVNGAYVFKPLCSDRLVMDVSGGSTQTLANVQLWGYLGGTPQMFYINKLGTTSSSGKMEVIRKIIYAVETGGQVYGQADYTNFTEAFTNSSTEYAITIGAGQWYATEAKTLLNNIRTRDPQLFNSLDNAGIGYDLDHSNWNTYRVSKGSAKAKCIQNIIGTSVGRACQDALIESQMQVYMNEAAKLGVTDLAAQMMCANIRHQGGYGALTRVLGKTAKPYTLDNIYSALQTDTGNQVGAYRSRQKMVYNSLKKYI